MLPDVDKFCVSIRQAKELTEQMPSVRNAEELHDICGVVIGREVGREGDLDGGIVKGGQLRGLKPMRATPKFQLKRSAFS